MAKKFFDGKCIHCLKYKDKLTADHIFPKAWYPDNISQNLEKWQAPSCQYCNQKYGKIESALLIKFGMMIDPDNPITANVVEKAKRALNPIYSKNEKDRIHRLMQRIKTINSLIPRDKIKASSLLPAKRLAEHPGSVVIAISQDSIRLMGEKFIRGITYILDKKYIESTHQIEIYLLDKQAALPIVEPIEKYGKQYSCTDGLVIKRAMAKDDSISGIYCIEIWDKFYFYGIVSPNS